MLQRKRKKNIAADLYIYKCGIEVQLEQAQWHMDREDLSEKEKLYWSTIKKFRERDLNEISKILNMNK